MGVQGEVRVGAKVTVGGTVTEIYRYDSDGIRANVMFGSSSGTRWFNSGAFLTVDNPPEALHVGDSVKPRGWGDRGYIIAIDADAAWVLLEGGIRRTFLLDHLECIPVAVSAK